MLLLYQKLKGIKAKTDLTSKQPSKCHHYFDIKLDAIQTNNNNKITYGINAHNKILCKHSMPTLISFIHYKLQNLIIEFTLSQNTKIKHTQFKKKKQKQKQIQTKMKKIHINHHHTNSRTLFIID